MFRNALQLLHKPLQAGVESLFHEARGPRTTLAVLSFAALIIVLDNTLS